jgi:hypothetical protein
MMKDPNELNKLAFELTAKLLAIPTVGPDSLELIRRDRVAELVAEWRRKWDALAAAPSADDSYCHICAFPRGHAGCKCKPSAAPGDAQDAARYRFLRHADLDAVAAAHWKDGEVPTGEEFDAVIDSAMLAAAPAAPSAAQEPVAAPDHKQFALVMDRHYEGQGITLAVWNGENYQMTDGDCYDRDGDTLGVYPAEFLTDYELEQRLNAAPSAAPAIPVGEVIANDPIHGWHMRALVDWEAIGSGTKLYTHPAPSAAPGDAQTVRNAALEEAAQIAERTYARDAFRFSLGREAAQAIRELKDAAAPAAPQQEAPRAALPEDVDQRFSLFCRECDKLPAQCRCK